METAFTMNWLKSCSGLFLCTLLVLGGLAPAAFPKDKEAAPPVCDKRYKMFTRDGETEIGTYHLRASSKGADKGKQIEIEESMKMDYRGKKISMVSSVTYENNKVAPAMISAKKGVAETRIGGEICMKGSVTIAEKSVDYECTGFLDKRSGKKHEPPKKFAKKGEPLPPGPVIFQSALIALGPKFLPHEGELKEFAWVEFPDDIGAPEIINIKEGFRLVREEADEDGEFVMILYDGDDDETEILAARYSKDGQLSSIERFGKFKLVEDKETK